MCTKDSKYGRAVYCNAPNSGPLQGNGADSGDMGHEKVVVEGDTGPGGRVGSDDGIRKGYGGGGDRGRSRGSSRKLNHGIN